MNMTKSIVDETPGRWVLVQAPGEDHVRVLAMYSGGYLDGDSWRLNSGITEVEEATDCFLVRGLSGSVYKLGKENQGLTLVGSDPINQYNLTVLDDAETFLRYFEKKS